MMCMRIQPSVPCKGRAEQGRAGQGRADHLPCCWWGCPPLATQGHKAHPAQLHPGGPPGRVCRGAPPHPISSSHHRPPVSVRQHPVKLEITMPNASPSREQLLIKCITAAKLQPTHRADDPHYRAIFSRVVVIKRIYIYRQNTNTA